MNTHDTDLEKLIYLVDANRVGLEKLRMELLQLKQALESQGLKTVWRGRGSKPKDSELPHRRTGMG